MIEKEKIDLHTIRFVGADGSLLDDSAGVGWAMRVVRLLEVPVMALRHLADVGGPLISPQEAELPAEFGEMRVRGYLMLGHLIAPVREDPADGQSEAEDSES
ncbi:hypothetical protein Bequi_09745 [Brachybacterium sp. JHP9]|uniref:Uncharacterized protein n=1 Tax=Brachybacterium equifaecis TaxID=2910770 RepID=A0ABT0R1L7_9MICO|nr:hypothetical protein [Brachybacterium equifaecis]MCL6423665.1 hypothetical protein [Brachybacterium equifaecis]